MDGLAEIGAWITANEALLSGIAALIVVAGVVFTPLGVGLRRIVGRASEPAPQPAASASPTEPVASPAPAPSAVRADRPSIAVLPLAPLSSDPEHSFLADGMSEDLITALAATRNLHVVSRNSTFAYKGQSPDIRAVGRDLGVRYVLEGSLRPIGESLRTTVQLIETESGNHLWAEKYDRSASELTADQDEVINEIAGALSVQLTAAEMARLREIPVEELTASERVTKAIWGAFRSNIAREAAIDARELLRGAVELDPDHVDARAAYAWLLVLCAINGFDENPLETIRAGVDQLRAARERDTSDAQTQFFLGAAHVYMGRPDRAVRYLERSLESNPHQPDAMAHLALARAYLGDFDEAYALFDRADRMLPGTARVINYYSWYRGIALGLQDRYAEAIPILRGVVENIPRYAMARVTLGIALHMTGDVEAARTEIARALANDPGLCLEGLALNVGAHSDPEKGAERAAVVRRYWPSD